MHIDFRTFFTHLHHDVPVLIILFMVIVMNYLMILQYSCYMSRVLATIVHWQMWQHMFVMKLKNVCH